MKESKETEIFSKTYDGESVSDAFRDMSEALQEEYNPVWKNIPQDEHGFSKGKIKVSIIFVHDEE